MIKVGIIGANGFLGLELLRILSIHPKVSIQKILKRENDIDAEFTHLSSLNLSELQTTNLSDFHNLDCVFLALPHGSAEEYVKDLIEKVKNRLNIPITALGGVGSPKDMSKTIDKFGIIGCAAGSLFVFKGKYKAVLINYPNQEKKNQIINNK